MAVDLADSDVTSSLTMRDHSVDIVKMLPVRVEGVRRDRFPVPTRRCEQPLNTLGRPGLPRDPSDFQSFHLVLQPEISEGAIETLVRA